MTWPVLVRLACAAVWVLVAPWFVDAVLDFGASPEQPGGGRGR